MRELRGMQSGHTEYVTQALASMNSLDPFLDEFDTRTFQGAPLLSRTDPGDGFDYMLAGWLSNNSQSAHIQSNQDVHDCHFQNYQTPGNQYANNQGQVVYPSQCSQPAVRQQNLPMYTPGQYQAQALPNPDMETASMSTEFGQPQFMLPSTISQPPRSLPNSSQLLDHQALASHSHSMDEPSQPFSSSTPQILSTGMSQPYANEKPAPHIPSSEASYPQGSQPLGSLGQSLQPSHIQNTTKAGYGQSLSHLTHSKDTRSIPQNLSQTTQEARHESNSSPMAVMSRDSSQGSGGVSQGVHATTRTDPVTQTPLPSVLKTNAQSPLFPQLPAFQPKEHTVEGAKQAWGAGPKRKRGPMSAASKEKERARNRRAQKKFREREKERQEERQNIMDTLESQLAQLKQEKDELARRNLELEEKAVKSMNEEINNRTCLPFDGPLYMETLHEGYLAEVSSSLERSRILRGINLKNLPYKEYTRIYKTYVDGLHAALMDNKPERQEQLINLIQELCDFNLYLALNTSTFGQFICGRMDTGILNTDPVPSSTWHRCLAGLMLSQQQKEAMLSTRRRDLLRLKPILLQHKELHRLVSMCGPLDDPSSALRRGQNAQILDAVEKLKKNLHHEQGLVVETLCVANQQFLAPEQTALTIVLAYPYYPDMPTLVDVLACETPGEKSAKEILEIDVLPN